MLWRVRAALPDQPGTLAKLAQACGAADVNIVGIQIFPGVESVTDELVLDVPPPWGAEQISTLVAFAGARQIVAHPVGDDALADQPTRFVQAARLVAAEPERFPEVVAGLFDAEAEGDDAGRHDVMEMTVGEVVVQIRRLAPFTTTERARGTAMARLVDDAMVRRHPALGGADPVPDRRLGTGATPTFVVAGDRVTALVAGTRVGEAVLADDVEPGARRADLEVDPAWRRRGIGTRLLLDVGRLARSSGCDELVFRADADNQAVLPMVLGAGLRSRIRMAGHELTVRVPVRDLAPHAEAGARPA